MTEYLSAHFHLVLFFYNPNITEKDEYEKRKQELLRLISEKEYPGKIDIVEADYDSEKATRKSRNAGNAAFCVMNCGFVRRQKRQSAMEQIISARHCRSVHIKMQEN